MRHGMTLAFACLLVGTGILPAQERIATPPPDSPPTSPPIPIAQTIVPPAGPPAPLSPPPPGPYLLYPPPPGVYGAPPPYLPPVLFFRDPAGNPSLWIGLEGLLWKSKNQPLSVPVVTSGPASQGSSAGNLGAQGTTSLNGRLNLDMEGGARFFMGGWFDSDHTIGLEGSLFGLSRVTTGFSVVDPSGTGRLVLNEPLAGGNFNTQVSAPGVATGSVVVDASTRFDGGDLNVLYNLYRGNGWTVNLLGGYRYLELDESLTITGNSSPFTTATYIDNMSNVLATAPPGSAVIMIDQFGTRNQFNGGQIGAEVQYLLGRWSFGGTGKLAIGATYEKVNVNGATYVNGTPIPNIGGNYASLQIGRYAMYRFAFAPETQLTVGYQFTPWIRGQLGYNFLYLSSVVRPGNQIDNAYDGVVHPTVPMTSSSFWGQGLNMSVHFSF